MLQITICLEFSFFLLDRQMIESFMKRENIEFPYDRVRTKIVNERAKMDSIKTRRAAMLNLDT